MPTGFRAFSSSSDMAASSSGADCFISCYSCFIVKRGIVGYSNFVFPGNAARSVLLSYEDNTNPLRAGLTATRLRAEEETLWLDHLPGSVLSCARTPACIGCDGRYQSMRPPPDSP